MTGLTWNEKGECNGPLKKNNTKIEFDVIPISEHRLRVYFTAGGDLSIWETDGEKWELVKDHVMMIEGPFLVLDQGRSALVQRNGKWGLLAPLGEASPQFTAIVERDGDEPIRVAEDRDAGVNYFIYKDDILDAQGRVLDRVPPGLDSEERLIHLTRFALGRRAPK